MTYMYLCVQGVLVCECEYVHVSVHVCINVGNAHGGKSANFLSYFYFWKSKMHGNPPKIIFLVSMKYEDPKN